MILLCGCVGVFTTLHINAQSGRCTLEIICHSHWSFQEKNNYTYFENLGPDATKGIHSLYLYSCY